MSSPVTPGTPSDQSVRNSGTFEIGGDLPVRRLGFGAMRIVGEDVWGPPTDRANSLLVLRRAVELGVTLIDTAEIYGPYESEELIREALHPYPDDLVIATKGGIDRPSKEEMNPDGRPEFLRAGVEGSLRRLRVDRIDLWQLHRIDPAVPVEESLGALVELRAEGKIDKIGLSEVSSAELQRAERGAAIATVQNRYSVADRQHEALVTHCERAGIGFIPWFPLATGKLAEPGGPLQHLSEQLGATRSQLALAWLLLRSTSMLPIPPAPDRRRTWRRTAGPPTSPCPPTTWRQSKGHSSPTRPPTEHDSCADVLNYVWAVVAGELDGPRSVDRYYAACDISH